MGTKGLTVLGLLGLSLLTTVGYAQSESGIYVEYWNGSAWVHVLGHPDRHKNPPDAGYTSGSDIDIVNANNVTYQVFAVTPSSTDIGDISINAPSNTVQPRLLVGRFTFLTEPVATQQLDVAGCRDLGGVYCGTGKTRVQAWVKGDILSGGVDTHEVVRLDVDGDILGPISHRPVQGLTPPLGWLRVVGNIDPQSGGVVAFGGDIDNLQTVSGDLLCGVSAIAGDIEKIRVGGTIGAPGAPVAIEALGAIKLIDVPNGDLHAEITATKLERNAGIPHEQCVDVDGNIADTTIILTDAIRDNFIITGGDFTQNSSIHAWSIGDAGEFSIIKTVAGGGYLKGDITFTGHLSPQSPFRIDESLEGTLNIGLHLWDTVTINGISSGGDGLVGQIIVNGTNTTGQWLSPVIVGGATLAPTPYYDDKSSTIGGGAVGLVPYNCHLRDCDPAAAQPYLAECDDGYNVIRKMTAGHTLDSVTLRHYGRILQHGSGKPFTVKRKANGTPACTGGVPNWYDVTDAVIGGPFTHTLHPGGGLRDIKISGPFEPGFDYLVEPKVDVGGGDYLFCDDLDLPADVGLFEYDYRLRIVLIQDINLNGMLQPDDITAWLASPVDTTLDGVADGADLVDVTEAVAESGDW